VIALASISHVFSKYGWWIVSRSSGIVAFVLITISVLIGLTMAGKPVRDPQFTKNLRAVHEQTALAGLVAITVHGFAIFADPWLKPGITGVAVPFALSVHTFWTGLGVIAGYMAMLLGLSFYLRRQIGARLWRKAHRATIAVYVLGLFHALGAGTDTGSMIFLIWAVGTAVPIAILFVYRLGTTRRSSERRRAAVRERARTTSRALYDTV
jgi:sulfoxide reductase heme-binding subunit YedZ